MKTGKIITWNTGCKYTAKGQRIAVKVLEDGFLFVDIDRGIDGFIPFNKVKSKIDWYEEDLDSDDNWIYSKTIKNIVNHAYLHENYDLITDFDNHYPIIKKLQVLAEKEE